MAITVRHALRLALGVPPGETEVETVLAIALDVLEAEASVLLSEDSTLDKHTRVSIEYSHLRRIEALRLLDGHLSARWKEAANG